LVGGNTAYACRLQRLAKGTDIVIVGQVSRHGRLESTKVVKKGAVDKKR
jgi:hypothetical protein